MTTYEYLIDQDTRLIHVIDQNPAVGQALCGKDHAGLIIGDETTSGIAINCPGCRAVFGPTKGRSAHVDDNNGTVS